MDNQDYLAYRQLQQQPQQMQQQLSQQNYKQHQQNLNNQYSNNNGLSIIEDEPLNNKSEGGHCHGCGHPGHSRPTCPFKDMPGWVAKGKRVQPLDIYQTAPPVTNVGVCHGCGHFGHSRNVCPYKDLPGWFHYGQRRVPLDISSKSISSPSTEVCPHCGIPGHNRNQCPNVNKDNAIRIQSIQRPQELPPQSNTIYINNNETVPHKVIYENHTESPSNAALESEFTSAYVMSVPTTDTKCVPLVPAVCQSTINPVETFQVSVLLDPSKFPNMISKKLFDQICLSGDASISRRDINVQLHDRILSLTYFTRLQLAFIDVNFEIEEEFYMTDSVIDIVIGYNMIFNHGLYQLFNSRFAINNNKMKVINSQNTAIGSQITSASENPSAPIPPAVISGPPPSNNYTKNNISGGNNNSSIFIPTSAISTYTNLTNTTTYSYPFNNDINNNNELNDNTVWYGNVNQSHHYDSYDIKSDDNISGFSHLNVSDNNN
mmetsp:Transcript_7144/g.6411  ORF Transcript_7144/g.6411 Transcript_7144/m.6411 type:complete len:488 (+) Transcript_7144:132-1595(+)